MRYINTLLLLLLSIFPGLHSDRRSDPIIIDCASAYGAPRRSAPMQRMHNIEAVISFFLANIVLFSISRNCLDDVDSLYGPK